MSFVWTWSKDWVLTFVNNLAKERKFLTIFCPNCWNILIINSPRAHNFFSQLFFFIFVVHCILPGARLFFLMIFLLFVIEPRWRRIKWPWCSCSRIYTVSLKPTCWRPICNGLHRRGLSESWLLEQSATQTSNLGARLDHQGSIGAWILETFGIRLKYWRLLILLHIFDQLEGFIHILSHFLLFNDVKDLLTLLVILCYSSLRLCLGLFLEPSSSWAERAQLVTDGELLI